LKSSFWLLIHSSMIWSWSSFICFYMLFEQFLRFVLLHRFLLWFGLTIPFYHICLFVSFFPIPRVIILLWFLVWVSYKLQFWLRIVVSVSLYDSTSSFLYFWWWKSHKFEICLWSLSDSLKVRFFDSKIYCVFSTIED